VRDSPYRPTKGRDELPPTSFADRSLIIADIEERHFWFVARRDLIKRLLRASLGVSGASIIDIGCGTGLFVGHLSRTGYRAIGTDININASHFRKRSARCESGFVQSSAMALPFKAKFFDCALLLDVLEHVDPAPALVEARRVLRPSGILLVTVPAFPWLWSHRDKAAGHRTRFRKESIKDLLARAGFEVERVHYYQCLLFPLFVASRLLGRSSRLFSVIEERPGKMVNRIATAISRLEVRGTGFVPWPIGSTLVCVARKEG